MDQNCSPKISICIPTLNRMDYLKVAIKSCLSQTYHNFEIVISDNNSDDSTEQMVSSFSDSRIKYVKHGQRVPLVANLNRCIEQASGDFLTFLCDDDYLDKQYLEELSNLLYLNPTAELAQCGCKYVDAAGVTKEVYEDVPPQRNSVDLLYNIVEMHNSVGLVRNLCRREIFVKVGGFVDLGIPTGFYSDTVSFTKVALEGKIVVGTKLPLYNFRWHDKNASEAIVGELEDYLSPVPQFRSLLTDLLLKHQCQIEKSKLDEWEMNLYAAWVLLDIKPRRSNISMWKRTKKLPAYFYLINKYMVRSKYSQFLKYTISKLM
ncbi:glycosyltransferase family A protein [Methanolobus sp. ZRKC5]|uniref:glycosyltransferase family 2 protein n=1 Tax=unclassified Methanolobus TaxID=2629569 RepID=UPI00313D0315